jgi:hypothetical protein
MAVFGLAVSDFNRVSGFRAGRLALEFPLALRYNHGDERILEEDVMRGRFHAAGWSAVVLAAGLWGCTGKPIVFPEGPKIEHLLKYIAETKDATFLIDGQSRDAAFAADYFRRGLAEKQATSRTAKEFIETVCSFSPTNGSPFLVQSADGNQTFLSGYLLAELERHEREIRRSQ